MKSRILRGWNFVRRFWLVVGAGIAIAAVIDKNFLLLLPALYFAVGAILNVGCFAASCAINFKQKQNDAHSDEKNIQARPDTQNH